MSSNQDSTIGHRGTQADDYGSPMLDFRILGPLEVAGGGGPLLLGGPKQRAVLAILLLNANRVVSVERLAEDLYAGAPPVTAVTQVQRQVSELRKMLGASTSIETHAPGYVIRVQPDQLDLSRFERTTEQASHALVRGDPERAAELFRTALDLWRGEPLADLASEAFAGPPIRRLEEIRLSALEQRIDADLALGRHKPLVGELESLCAEHPLREQLHARLILALYRSGRQAEALEAYRRARTILVDEFGIEPTAELRDLERAILRQDPSLDLGRMAAPALAEPSRAVLLVASDDAALDALLAIGAQLTLSPLRELIVARLVVESAELESASSTLEARHVTLRGNVRSAAFTSRDPAGDTVRLATTHNVELILIAAPEGTAATLPPELVELLETSPAGVGLVAGPTLDLSRGSGIFVPFGGGEHEWAALELATQLAASAELPLRLVGTEADPQRKNQDASRLLADASLAVQRLTGIAGTPVLADPTPDGLVVAVASATVVVAGMASRWRTEGIGSARRALIEGARAPTILVHSGLRPGALAPAESRTRFSWSMA